MEIRIRLDLKLVQLCLEFAIQMEFALMEFRIPRSLIMNARTMEIAFVEMQIIAFVIKIMETAIVNIRRIANAKAIMEDAFSLIYYRHLLRIMSTVQVT